MALTKWISYLLALLLMLVLKELVNDTAKQRHGCCREDSR